MEKTNTKMDDDLKQSLVMAFTAATVAILALWASVRLWF
jgi:hypothetical protein